VVDIRMIPVIVGPKAAKIVVLIFIIWENGPRSISDIHRIQENTKVININHIGVHKVFFDMFIYYFL